MRDRVPWLLLLGSALVFLASLYLPWHFTPGGGVDGWSSVGTGAMAGLFALALAASAAAAFVRPSLARRVPVGRLALGTGYFGLAAYLQLRDVLGLGLNGQQTHFRAAYGVYVALGAAAAALLAAAPLRVPTLLRRPSPAEAVTAFLGAGLLVAYLLPWYGGPAGMGLAGVTATLAAAGLWLGANLWRREADAGQRLAVAVGSAVLTGAALSLAEYYPVQRYGAWVGLGLSLALVAVAALTARGRWEPALRSRQVAARAAPPTLLLVSLFLPWQGYSQPAITANGWTNPWGALAGAGALVLLTVVVLRRSETYLPELVSAVAVFTATVGFEIASPGGIAFRYGAYVGFAAAALLVLVSLGLPPIGLVRARLRFTAVAACLAFLAITVVPMWSVLSLRLRLESPWHLYWLATAGILLALHLLATWLRQPGSGERAVWIPLGLLILVTLDLVQWRQVEIGWGGIAIVVLCLLLALLGWIERGGGARKIPLPEILRIDRLPEAQG